MTKDSAVYSERVAGEWNTIRAGDFTEAVREAAIARAYLRPEMVVADVGAGTGFMAAGLAPLVSRVYVLDGLAAMLNVARRNLSGCDNVVFLQTDGEVLTLPDASVDAVFANLYLHHCPDPAATVREMVRLLKPGGRLMITDMDIHPHAWMREEMADVWLGFARSQIKTWLRQAGLVNLIVDSTGQYCCAESQHPTRTDPTSRTAQVSIFLATGSKRVAGAREAVQATYGAIATAQGGCCSSPAPAAIPDERAKATAGAERSCCGASEPTVQQSCCGPAAGDEREVGFGILNYSNAELAAVPAEAAALSLGCGNPGALASLRPGEAVLDIGSGAGIDAFYAARRVGPTGWVVGLDMTPAMIERARAAAAAAGLSQVEFHLGQAEAMPLEDGIMDVVMSNCVINLCEDKGKVFEEAYRVLKVGGRLAISDVVTDKPLPMSVRSDPAQWAGCVHGALPQSEYLDLIRQAGFQKVVATASELAFDIEGVKVYTLSVLARKDGELATNDAATETKPLTRSAVVCSCRPGCCD